MPRGVYKHKPQQGFQIGHPVFSNKGRFKKGQYSGKSNPQWKGNKAGIVAIHSYIKNHYGKPNKCEDCGTTKAKKFEWANISGEYHRDIKDFKRLCTKCHRAFDKTVLIGEEHPNSKLTVNQVKRIRNLYIPFKYGVKKLGKEFNINHRTVYDIVKRRNWKHIDDYRQKTGGCFCDNGKLY